MSIINGNFTHVFVVNLKTSSDQNKIVRNFQVPNFFSCFLRVMSVKNVSSPLYELNTSIKLLYHLTIFIKITVVSPIIKQSPYKILDIFES